MGILREAFESVKEAMWPRPPEMADLEEILMHHADRLIRGGNGHGDVSSLAGRFPRDRELVGDLLAIAVEISRALAPVPPAPAFRQRLQNELMRRAREFDVIVAEPDRHSLWQERRTEILIGATLGSVLSAGLVFLIRHLVTRQAHTAEPARAGVEQG